MIKKILIALIVFYKKAVSPFLPPACRFHPTCSDYAKEAVETHGAARGALLAAARLLKCHPYHRGGYDPVPPVKDSARVHNAYYKDTCNHEPLNETGLIK